MHPPPSMLEHSSLTGQTLITPRRSERIASLLPCLYSNIALTGFAIQALSGEQTTTPCTSNGTKFCAPVIHPTTRNTITEYKLLQRDPLLRVVWEQAFGKDFGNLAQSDTATNTPGTNLFVVLAHHDQINSIQKDRTVTYTTVVVDY